MQALNDIVRSGKALYVGISNYSTEQAEIAITTLKNMGTHMLIHQPNYSMLNRYIEYGLTDMLTREGVGCIAFAPLAGGVLAGRYTNGFDSDSRDVNDPRYLRPESVTQEKINTVKELTELAENRGQTVAQMALAWTLRSDSVTSALIGASKPEQILENVKALDKSEFSNEELSKIDKILAKGN
jgi:L-glyceraldehyde 3-phosphate reductase